MNFKGDIFTVDIVVRKTIKTNVLSKMQIFSVKTGGTYNNHYVLWG
jgi:hypothetical protein